MNKNNANAVRLAITLWLIVNVSGCAPKCQRDKPLPPVESAQARVVSLHDVTSEMVVALGAVDKMVGVAEPVDASASLIAAIIKVPRVGSLETILATRPSVVLGLRVVEEQDPELVTRLREKGIEVHLADQQDLSSVSALLQTIAERVEAVATGQKMATQLNEKVSSLTVQPKRPRRVFVFDCCNPPFTAGGKTVLSDIIQRAGGRNIFDDLNVAWTSVSWEEVIARKPELIVIHSYKFEGQGDVPDKQKALRAIPSLAKLPIAVLPLRYSLGGLQSVQGLEDLGKAMRRQ